MFLIGSIKKNYCPDKGFYAGFKTENHDKAEMCEVSH